MPTSARTMVAVAEVRRFIVDVMCSVGAPIPGAEQLSRLLTAADCRGHFSHGLSRLPYYVHDVRTGVCEPHAQPTVVRESASTALVDGAHGLGVVVGEFCVDVAVRQARTTGVGWVAATNSNHYGIAGWYALRCARAGLLGFSFSNSSPLVVADGGRQALLGSNPISCAVPAACEDDGAAATDLFCLDMATCTVALGKVEVQRALGEQMPLGWAVDQHGADTSDPHQCAALLPLGGYKGYGLALLVEVLCGVTAGAAYGPLVRRWNEQQQPARLGQCFVAVDVRSCLEAGFDRRLRHLLQLCRASPPKNATRPVMVAGDPEASNERRVERCGGVEYHSSQLQLCSELAAEMNVAPLQTMAVCD